MCKSCITGICAFFDALVADYHRDFPPAPAHDEERVRRPKYMPMDVSNAPESAASKDGFNNMALAADGIGMSRMEFLTGLSQRCGFGAAIMGWAQGKIPNGLARKVILTAAEEILRENGAQPKRTMQDAA